MSRPRILVMFGNVPLLGQELGNIDAMTAMRESGAEVLFLIRREWTADSIQKELSRRNIPWATVPYFDTLRKGHGLRVWWVNVCGILGGSWRLLRWHRKFRPTHLHVASTSSLINFLPALCLLRTPLVFRVGDDMTLHHWLWRLVWRFALLRTWRFVAISRFLLARLSANGADASRVRLVSNISPRRYRGASGAEKRCVERISDRFTFLFVGQITRQKGVDVLIEAALRYCRESEACKFLIVGDTGRDNPLAGDLMRLVREAGLLERIEFVGYQRDVASYMAVSDVHICPSVGIEAYGQVVIEAKQNSLPSIIFPTGGLPELVRHGVDGWVCREATANELIGAMRYYEFNPEARLNHAQAAVASLRGLGSDRYEKDWVNVYAGD